MFDLNTRSSQGYYRLPPPSSGQPFVNFGSSPVFVVVYLLLVLGSVHSRFGLRLRRANVNTTLLNQLARPIRGKAKVFLGNEQQRSIHLTHLWKPLIA